MKVTVNEIIADIKDRYPSAFSDTKLLLWLNTTLCDVWKEIAVSEIYEFVAEKAIRTYPLPDDCEIGSITAITVNGRECRAKNIPDFTGARNYYELLSGVICLEPVPQGGERCFIYYEKRCPVLEAGGIINEYEELLRSDFIELLKLGVFIIMAEAQEDIAKANTYSQAFSRLLLSAKSDKFNKQAAYPVIRNYKRRNV